MTHLNTTGSIWRNYAKSLLHPRAAYVALEPSATYARSAGIIVLFAISSALTSWDSSANVPLGMLLSIGIPFISIELLHRTSHVFHRKASRRRVALGISISTVACLLLLPIRFIELGAPIAVAPFARHAYDIASLWIFYVNLVCLSAAFHYGLMRAFLHFSMVAALLISFVILVMVFR